MKRARILVADSNETARTKVCALLGKKGYLFYAASDSSSAIRIAKTVYPDLILMDLNLWGRNALDTARLLGEGGSAPVLFLSKPIQPQLLFQEVEASLGRLKLSRGREEKLAIEAAKGFLMEAFQLSEKEAFEKLRRRSMDQCLPLIQVARQILATNRSA